MSVLAGDITEITYNHPTIGSGVLLVKSDEDSELDLGGYKSSDEDKGVDSGGNMIDTMTNSRWKATAVIAGDLMGREEIEKLQQLTENSVLGTFTISHISGATYQGVGKPVGDVKQSLKNATIALTLSGGGKLKKVA